jgi:hypothetical protein
MNCVVRLELDGAIKVRNRPINFVNHEVSRAPIGVDFGILAITVRTVRRVDGSGSPNTLGTSVAGAPIDQLHSRAVA